MKKLSKKGVSVWISYVLVILFTVTLSVFMYNWIFGHAESTRDKMLTLVDTDECQLVGIKLEACQNTQTLYINATNIKNVVIDRIVFRLINVYDEPERRETNITISPGETIKINLLKDYGITNDLEALPTLVKDDKQIICESRKATLSSISLCNQ